MLIRRLSFEIMPHIRQYPNLYFPLMRTYRRLRRSSYPPLVNEETELVIEGFFRCANTFAVAAFVRSQPGKVRLANHSHAPATILRAARLGIPTLVLIREPAETVLSLLLKLPDMTMRQAFHWYERYYTAIRPARAAFMVADFQEVTSDFGNVIEKVNHRYGIYFEPFRHTPEAVQGVFERIRYIESHVVRDEVTKFALPLQSKEKEKALLRRQLSNSRIRPLLTRTKEIYDRYMCEEPALSHERYKKSTIR